MLQKKIGKLGNKVVLLNESCSCPRGGFQPMVCGRAGRHYTAKG